MTVRQIQLLLSYLGFDPGPADGIRGEKTEGAIRAFRQRVAPEEDVEEALRRAVWEGLPAAKDFWEEIPNFTRQEFACKCGMYHAPYCDGFPARMDERAVRLAQSCRTHFGRPAHVVSGLRCRQHNADSGGVASSRHMAGKAVDLQVEGVSAGELLDYVNQQPGVRYAYAINGTNVHFDV